MLILGRVLRQDLPILRSNISLHECVWIFRFPQTKGCRGRRPSAANMAADGILPGHGFRSIALAFRPTRSLDNRFYDVRSRSLLALHDPKGRTNRPRGFAIMERYLDQFQVVFFVRMDLVFLRWDLSAVSYPVSEGDSENSYRCCCHSIGLWTRQVSELVRYCVEAIPPLMP